MPTRDVERRLAPRRTPSRERPPTYLRLLAGPQLLVRDLSTLGALVESGVRLLPGTRARVHVPATHGRALVPARVVRSEVTHVTAGRTSYCSALAFERPIDIVEG
jgi:hypothetical protein